MRLLRAPCRDERGSRVSSQTSKQPEFCSAVSHMGEIAQGRVGIPDLDSRVFKS